MRKQMAALFTLPFLLIACGGGSEQASTVTAVEADAKTESVKSKVDDAFNQDQINRALLAKEDLPAGFETEAVGEEEEESEETPSGCEELDKLDNLTKEAEVKGEAKFIKGGDFGTRVSEQISAWPDKGKDTYDALVKALQACPSFETTDDDGTKTTINISPLNVSKQGDGTFAARLTMVTFIGPINIDYVIIRAGDNILFVTQFAIGATDEALTNQIAQKSVEKLNSVR